MPIRSITEKWESFLPPLPFLSHRLLTPPSAIVLVLVIIIVLLVVLSVVLVLLVVLPVVLVLLVVLVVVLVVLVILVIIHVLLRSFWACFKFIICKIGATYSVAIKICFFGV